MAQDDAGEKTEQPTPRRRQEAREEGQVPRSTDLTAAVGLLAALVLLNMFGPGMFERMLLLIREMVDVSDVSGTALRTWIARAGYAAAAILLPFLLLLMVLTAAGAVAQTGLLLTPKKLIPKLENLSPIKGVKRLFSFDSVTRTGLGLFKMGLIGLIAYYTVVARIQPVLGSGTLPPAGIMHLAAGILFALMLRLALVLLALGLIDYFYQRHKIEKQLRMNKQEIKDELKRMEGDPLLKMRRRQAQARLAMQRIAIDVPRSDVVVTNPTEYAVALRYDEATMPAPRLLAKGKDLLALRIRRIAQEHSVPIVQRPPLARGLYVSCEVGDEVPMAYYRAVAEVLAYVYQLSGRAAG
ncbi:MAG: flagellar biosynthesis protein FlhB [Planctomycetes bacterium]|nr:flagellar biosynthesis protein FlhB [Planctomycetota bacterium]